MKNRYIIKLQQQQQEQKISHAINFPYMVYVDDTCNIIIIIIFLTLYIKFIKLL